MTRDGSVRVYIACQLHRMYNHLGDKFQNISVRDFYIKLNTSNIQLVVDCGSQFSNSEIVS